MLAQRDDRRATHYRQLDRDDIQQPRHRGPGRLQHLRSGTFRRRSDRYSDQRRGIRRSGASGAGRLARADGHLAPLSQPLDPINRSRPRSSWPVRLRRRRWSIRPPPRRSSAAVAHSAAARTDRVCSVWSRVPIKVHLHNDAVLGPNCYIGSNADPIVLNLVETPTSSPQLTSGGPGGNAIISTGVEVADNTFAVPGANGCGLLGALDAALDLKVGLPSPSGKNSALIDQNGESRSCPIPVAPNPDSNSDGRPPQRLPTATAVATTSATATDTATATATATVTATATATPTATATATATRLRLGRRRRLRRRLRGS